MKTIKYVIADDHKIFRQGLRLALGTEIALKCAGEAGNGLELLELMQRECPEVVLLDIKMPGMDGVEALAHIKENYPQAKVLILTMFDDELFIVRLMEKGANGYLLKNAEPDEISMAIYSVCDNDYYFSDLVSAAMLKQIVEKTKPQPKEAATAKLTDKETEVLKLICKELTAAEIAASVYLSVRTVEGIKSSLIEKTKVRNTTGLVLYAMRNGIVS